MKNIALIYGGESGEHEVSCVSATYLEQTIAEAGFSVVPLYIARDGVWHQQQKVGKLPADNSLNPANLQRTGRGIELVTISGRQTLIDFAFPIVHGTSGEDGALQGFFEVLGLPYAGCGIATSAACMDKALMRALFAANQIPQVRYFSVEASASIEEVDALIFEKGFQYPVFIKPCNMGSSVGVHKVKDKASLGAALKDAARFDDHLLCEEGLNVRELEIAIAGNHPDYIVSGVGEIRVKHEFYSYEAKYIDPNGAELFLKADIPEAMAGEIQAHAKKAFAAVRGEGFARVDFFLDKDSGKLFLNEINTLPGFTPISMFPQLFKEAGVSGATITGKIIAWGVERFIRLKQLHAAAR